jgi:uncharacterized protein YndB with AHSA1/START domain
MTADVPARIILAMTNATWTATARSEAAPQAVLEALVDPDAIARWSPVSFELEDDSSRLRPGTRARVSGRLGGVRVGFDVEVHRADEQQLRLRASGPVNMDVAYDISPQADGTAVSASVSLARGRGLAGRLLAEATAGLLHAGALSQAVNRIAAAA